jgi:superfamily II DNA or RNA helicase
MARLSFECERTGDGVVLRLVEKAWIGQPRSVPVEQWAERMGDQAFSGVSKVLALVDDAEHSVTRATDGLSLNYHTIASLTEPQALSLGLPPSTRVALQVDTKNLITDCDFRLTGRWIGEANRPLLTTRQGAFLSVNGEWYRLPQPLFDLVEAIDSFATPDSVDSDVRMARLAHIQSLVPAEAREQISPDAYFSSFRVLHATAFSLSLKIDARSFDFDPVLFGRRVVERLTSEGGLVSEAESLLTEHQQQVFAAQRFRSLETAKPSYVIERGVYLHVDPSLHHALTVVRQMQRADAETRKRFVQTPHIYLKEVLSDHLSDDEIERLFIETEQYSARVIDVGIWSPPVLPWIKMEPNDWLPEKFGLQIGGEYVVLAPDQLAPLRERIQQAQSEGEPFVEVGETHVRIPATPEAERALAKLIGEIRPAVPRQPMPEAEDGRAEKPTNEKNVLIVEENFEQLGFRRKVAPRARADSSFPAAIKPRLKNHQQSGLAWLQEAWLRGFPGTLLADDMGLGKTLQALSFLAWLRELRSAMPDSKVRKGPILIVAPTGLLANWEKEHNLHLHEPGLGELCRAYGRHLKVLKMAKARDIDQGAPALDQRRIQQADWVLTTYETLRDYHMSFAAIPFACAVLDEMQKVKSPSSLLTRAAKTINADFTLGLTGTPIENHLADLWCIMDVLDPGCLGDLKSFTTKFQPDDMDALERLRSMLLDGSPDRPALVLRRMKADHLDGLPEKNICIRKRAMPEIQARVYGEIVARAKQPGAGPMLETLHLLRSISLHPTWPPAVEITEPKSFIEQSARLTETFAILDEIEHRREKVLIFLESLELQEHLALMIKNRYGLKRRPMQINGEIGGEKRQKLVDEFQSERGVFDVMILSPRAGGVGLTLTTASHVIHLSRWWNPAVEDQCTDRIYRIGQEQAVRVYYPMAIHPLYGESSFDELLHTLLTRKRSLSQRMLLPPVNLKQDENWFADNLGRTRDQAIEPANTSLQSR